MASAIRGIVSKKKKRFTQDGYDLDLSYVSPCKRIIAMGYPAYEVGEKLIRNNINDVKRFLEEKHKDHYKIYNLCKEREGSMYDKSLFHNRVEDYLFRDHHPPNFDLIQEFCDDATKWLKLDSANIVAVHCKAGKGRTGLMVCSLLLHMGVQSDPEVALQTYGKARTDDQKGVTIPSQRRYVGYYANYVPTRIQNPYSPKRLVFRHIHFHSPFVDNKIFRPFFEVSQWTPCSKSWEVVWSNKNQSGSAYPHPHHSHPHNPFQKKLFHHHHSQPNHKEVVEMAIVNPVEVFGDVNLTVFNSKKQYLFHFHFNTFFVRDEEDVSFDVASHVVNNNHHNNRPLGGNDEDDHASSSAAPGGNNNQAHPPSQPPTRKQSNNNNPSTSFPFKDWPHKRKTSNSDAPDKSRLLQEQLQQRQQQQTHTCPAASTCAFAHKKNPLSPSSYSRCKCQMPKDFGTSMASSKPPTTTTTVSQPTSPFGKFAANSRFSPSFGFDAPGAARSKDCDVVVSSSGAGGGEKRNLSSFIRHHRNNSNSAKEISTTMSGDCGGGGGGETARGSGEVMDVEDALAPLHPHHRVPPYPGSIVDASSYRQSTPIKESDVFGYCGSGCSMIPANETPMASSTNAVDSEGTQQQQQLKSPRNLDSFDSDNNKLWNNECRCRKCSSCDGIVIPNLSTTSSGGGGGGGFFFSSDLKAGPTDGGCNGGSSSGAFCCVNRILPSSATDEEHDQVIGGESVNDNNVDREPPPSRLGFVKSSDLDEEVKVRQNSFILHRNPTERVVEGDFSSSTNAHCPNAELGQSTMTTTTNTERCPAVRKESREDDCYNKSGDHHHHHDHHYHHDSENNECVATTTMSDNNRDEHGEGISSSAAPPSRPSELHDRPQIPPNDVTPLTFTTTDDVVVLSSSVEKQQTPNRLLSSGNYDCHNDEGDSSSGVVNFFDSHRHHQQHLRHEKSPQCSSSSSNNVVEAHHRQRDSSSPSSCRTTTKKTVRMLTTTLKKEELDHKKSTRRCSENLRVKMFFTLPPPHHPTSSSEESGVGDDGGRLRGGDAIRVVGDQFSRDDADAVVASSRTLVDDRVGGGRGEVVVPEDQTCGPHYRHRRGYFVSSQGGGGGGGEEGATLGINSETSSFHSESEANLTEDEADSDANAMESDSRRPAKTAVDDLGLTSSSADLLSSGDCDDEEDVTSGENLMEATTTTTVNAVSSHAIIEASNSLVSPPPNPSRAVVNTEDLVDLAAAGRRKYSKSSEADNDNDNDDDNDDEDNLEDTIQFSDPEEGIIINSMAANSASSSSQHPPLQLQQQQRERTLGDRPMDGSSASAAANEAVLRSKAVHTCVRADEDEDGTESQNRGMELTFVESEIGSGGPHVTKVNAMLTSDTEGVEGDEPMSPLTLQMSPQNNKMSH